MCAGDRAEGGDKDVENSGCRQCIPEERDAVIACGQLDGEDARADHCCGEEACAEEFGDEAAGKADNHVRDPPAAVCQFH
jgi:hypothetical protein